MNIKALVLSVGLLALPAPFDVQAQWTPGMSMILNNYNTRKALEACSTPPGACRSQPAASEAPSPSPNDANCQTAKYVVANGHVLRLSPTGRLVMDACSSREEQLLQQQAEVFDTISRVLAMKHAANSK
jgi:hypothetical protein